MAENVRFRGSTCQQQLSRHLLLCADSADEGKEGSKDIPLSFLPCSFSSAHSLHSLNHSDRDFLLCSVLFAKGPFEIASGQFCDHLSHPPTHPYKSNCGYKCRITRNIPSFLPAGSRNAVQHHVALRFTSVVRASMGGA